MIKLGMHQVTGFFFSFEIYTTDCNAASIVLQVQSRVSIFISWIIKSMINFFGKDDILFRR